MPPLRLTPILFCVALAGLAETGPKPIESTSDYQALLDASLTARPTEAQRLFERAVQVRVQSGELDESHARLAAHRQVAAALAARGVWMEAAAQADSALRYAQSLQETGLIIRLHLDRAAYLQKAGDVSIALACLDRADPLLRLTPDADAELESALLRAKLLSGNPSTRPEAEAIYHRLLAVPGVDALRVELARARGARIDQPQLFQERWSRVHEIAVSREDPAVVAEAADQLGRIACSLGDYALAARHFTAAEESAVPPERTVGVWLDVVKAYSRVDDRSRARRAIAAASALTDERRAPARAAILQEATGELLAREGDYPAAFAALRRANELRRAPAGQPQMMPITRLTPSPSKEQVAAAAELAAARNTLREVELERALLLQRQTLGTSVVAVLVAALLGLAYAYKRRSVAALAAARDNAELRADRTHWQMLRYQLNPHFLFNALSSLGGLVVTNPTAAGRVVDRLSEFCQLALRGSHEGLRSLAEEFEVLRAYLDVEQVGHGEALAVDLVLSPAAAPRLVPPLLLQPLVENALKYGGETSDDRLEITISAGLSVDGKTLEIEVANTGRWIERERESQQRDAVGLANVRERLARMGAPTDALTVAHADGWVRVHLRLPALAAPMATTP